MGCPSKQTKNAEIPPKLKIFYEIAKLLPTQIDENRKYFIHPGINAEPKLPTLEKHVIENLVYAYHAFYNGDGTCKDPNCKVNTPNENDQTKCNCDKNPWISGSRPKLMEDDWIPRVVIHGVTKGRKPLELGKGKGFDISIYFAELLENGMRNSTGGGKFGKAVYHAPHSGKIQTGPTKKEYTTYLYSQTSIGMRKTDGKHRFIVSLAFSYWTPEKAKGPQHAGNEYIMSEDYLTVPLWYYDFTVDNWPSLKDKDGQRITARAAKGEPVEPYLKPCGCPFGQRSRCVNNIQRLDQQRYESINFTTEQVKQHKNDKCTDCDEDGNVGVWQPQIDLAKWCDPSKCDYDFKFKDERK